jgi:hypothetical protein
VKIVTRYGANSKGAGKVTATTRIDGKSKQKTITYDHENSPGYNHGAAVAELLMPLVPVNRRGFVAATAKVSVDLDNGSMTFEATL